jgi:hypothetical protein
VTVEPARIAEVERRPEVRNVPDLWKMLAPEHVVLDRLVLPGLILAASLDLHPSSAGALGQRCWLGAVTRSNGNRSTHGSNCALVRNRFSMALSQRTVSPAFRAEDREIPMRLGRTDTR